MRTTAASTRLSAVDAAFLREALSRSLLISQLAAAAGRYAGNVQLLHVADELRNDHDRMIRELSALAAQGGARAETTLLPRHQAQLNRVTDKRGEAFDQDFILVVNTETAAAITAFRQHARHGADPNLRHFAEKEEYTLRKNLQSSRDYAEEEARLARQGCGCAK